MLFQYPFACLLQLLGVGAKMITLLLCDERKGPRSAAPADVHCRAVRIHVHTPFFDRNEEGRKVRAESHVVRFAALITVAFSNPSRSRRRKVPSPFSSKKRRTLRRVIAVQFSSCIATSMVDERAKPENEVHRFNTSVTNRRRSRPSFRDWRSKHRPSHPQHLPLRSQKLRSPLLP